MSVGVSDGYPNLDHGSRRISMTYPSGSVLNYNYGTANGTNDVISRLDNLAETNGNVTTTLESHGYLDAHADSCGA
jgi:hypothetical protein